MGGALDYFEFAMTRMRVPSLMATVAGAIGLGGGAGRVWVGLAEFDVI